MVLTEVRSEADLVQQIEAMMTGNWFTDLANIAAMLNDHLPRINWVGFYLMRKGKLWLGPFQGKAACTFIGLGKGVCGTAALERCTLVVDDVHKFPGHIACDSRSCSEIVVPLVVGDTVVGVLDVDAPIKNRFTESDRKTLEAIARIASRSLSEYAEEVKRSH